MPISIAQLRARTTSIMVPTPLGPVEVRFRPSALTPAMEQRFADASMPAAGASAAAAQLDGLLESFCEVVEFMDIAGPLADEFGREILDEHGNQLVADGELVPIEPYFLRHVAIDLILLTLQAIREHNTEESEQYAKKLKNAVKHSSTPSRRGSFDQ